MRFLFFTWAIFLLVLGGRGLGLGLESEIELIPKEEVKVYMLLPQSNEVYYASACKYAGEFMGSHDTCSYDLQMFLFANISKPIYDVPIEDIDKSFPETYSIHVRIENSLGIQAFGGIRENINFKEMISLSNINLKYSVNFPRSETYIKQTISVFEFSSNKTLEIFSKTVISLLIDQFDGPSYESVFLNMPGVHDIMLPIPTDKSNPTGTMSPRSDEEFGYIEIGTSKFDTVLHKLDELQTRNVDNNKIKGISIEIINHYLKQLPVLSNTCKANLAITINESIPFADVFYIPESIIDRIPTREDRHNLKGCTSINGIHGAVAWFIRRHSFPVEILRKSVVPSVTASQLLDFVHNNLGYSRIKLIKLDLEGLDQLVISNIIEYYVRKPEFKGPCVLAFETNYLSAKHSDYEHEFGDYRNPKIMDILRSVGYSLSHNDSNYGATNSESLAIDCKCHSSDIIQSLSLLHIDVSPIALASNVCSTGTVKSHKVVTVDGVIKDNGL